MSPIIGSTGGLSARGFGLFGGAAALASDYESIATVTLTSDGTASFPSIPSTYKHLRLMFIANNANTSFYKIALRFNSDTGSNYYWHYVYGDGSGTSGGVADETTAMRLTKLNYDNLFWSIGTIDIPDYADTNKFKTAIAFGGFDPNTTGNVEFASGLWRSKSAISQIDIAPYAGNYKSGSVFELYGLKG